MYQMFCVLALWLAQVIISSASGTLVHIEVQRRALYSLSLPMSPSLAGNRTTLPLADWISDSLSYAQAGAFFPDFGYNCLALDDEAEAAHWPPFLVTAVQYLVETYPNLEESKAGQALLSFILGFATHQNTDATWHSIKFNNGFLRVMADLDFGGSYSEAHLVLDTGADTILAKDFANVPNSRGFAHLSENWSVPVNDIIKMYERLGISLSQIKLRYCMTRGFAALSAMRRFGSTLTDRYQSQSPFMTLHLEDYYMGSLTETVTSTVSCWLAIEDWLITGRIPTQRKAWDVCEPMATIGRRGKAGPYTNRKLSNPLKHAAQAVLMHDNLQERYSEDFVNLISQEMQTVESSIDQATGLLQIKSTGGHTYSDDRHLTNVQQDSYFLTPSISYSRFGQSMILLETSSKTEIIVGSPEESEYRDMPSKGSVYVIPFQSEDARYNPPGFEESLVLAGGRFATTNGIAQGDSNSLDSHIASTANVETGAGASYFGRSIANLTIDGEQCLTILSSRKVEIFRYINGSLELTPSTTIHDQTAQQFSDAPIASYLFSFDHAGESVLAIASPWSGRRAAGVVHLFSSAHLKARLLQLDSADVVIKVAVTEAYYRFGSSMAYSKQHQMLLIGAAGGRSVTGFCIDLKRATARSVLQIVDPSEQQLDSGFGSSGLLVRGDHVYIGSMSEDQDGISQVGVVRVYRIMAPFRMLANLRIRHFKARLSVVLSPQQATPSANFGAQIVAAEHSKGTYISAPGFNLRGSISFVPDDHIFYASKSMTYGPRMLWTHQQHFEPLSQCLRIPICALGYEASARFGETLTVSSRGRIIVGAPHARGLSQEQHLAGKVYYFQQLLC